MPVIQVMSLLKVVELKPQMLPNSELHPFDYGCNGTNQLVNFRQSLVTISLFDIRQMAAVFALSVFFYSLFLGTNVFVYAVFRVL